MTDKETTKTKVRDQRAVLLTEEEAAATDEATVSAEETKREVRDEELTEILNRRAEEYDLVFLGAHVSSLIRALDLPRKKFAELTDLKERQVRKQERLDKEPLTDGEVKQKLWEKGRGLIALKMQALRETVQVLAFLADLLELYNPDVDARGQHLAEMIQQKIRYEELMKERQEAAMAAAMENPHGLPEQTDG